MCWGVNVVVVSFTIDEQFNTNMPDVFIRHASYIVCFMQAILCITLFLRYNINNIVCMYFCNCSNQFIIFVSLIKDARSVSLYPYNRSQILQYVKYTK